MPNEKSKSFHSTKMSNTTNGVSARLKRKAEALKQELVTIYLCWKDPLVAWYVRALILLILAYAASPIDLIPDFIPVIGYLDDLVLLPLGIFLVIRLIPKAVYDGNRGRARAMKDDPALKRIGILMTLGIWIFLIALILKFAKIY